MTLDVFANKNDASRYLYPAIEPYRSGYLPVSDGHQLYWEESGHPDGKPAVLLHGGPGWGTEPGMRRFFNPKRYRLVLFDQRGCGRSKPFGSLKANSTRHLVEDLEALRVHLNINRWLVFGGSWGSTLALVYAQTHPKRVTELVLRGIFLLRRSEVDWFYQNPEGAASIFPDRWDEYTSLIPKSERQDMLRAYYRRLTSANQSTLLRAARAWSMWEGATSYLRANAAAVVRFKDAAKAIALARIECHYFIHKGFFRRDGELLHNIGRNRQIPGVIIQGRYDVVCPMRSAWDLHKAWPQAELRIVDDAGHASFEVGIARELVRATDAFATP